MFPFVLKMLACCHAGLGLAVVVWGRVSRSFMGSASWFQQMRLQAALWLFDGCTALVLWGRN